MDILLFFLFLMALLLWLPLSIVIGFAGRARGRSFIGWFLAAIFFSPVIAFFLLLIFPRRDAGAGRHSVPP
jgi:hypothetical protein